LSPTTTVSDVAMGLVVLSLLKLLKAYP